jgi:hypothetical protein
LRAKRPSLSTPLGSWSVTVTGDDTEFPLQIDDNWTLSSVDPGQQAPHRASRGSEVAAQRSAAPLVGATLLDVVAVLPQLGEAAPTCARLRRLSPRARRVRKRLDVSGIGSATHNMTILAPFSKHRLPVDIPRQLIRSLRERHARTKYIGVELTLYEPPDDCVCLTRTAQSPPGVAGKSAGSGRRNWLTAQAEVKTR